MSMSRSSKMLHYINYRMKITLQDGRVLTGTFMAFDRHMNMVLGDTEETRTLASKKGQGLTEEKTEKRVLGLIILRGDIVVSLTVDGPPPADNEEKATPGGPGQVRVAGRGMPVVPLSGAAPGLAGPVRGVGGPMPSMMQPPPVSAMNARPPPMMMQGMSNMYGGGGGMMMPPPPTGMSNMYGGGAGGGGVGGGMMMPPHPMGMGMNMGMPPRGPPPSMMPPPPGSYPPRGI